MNLFGRIGLRMHSHETNDGDDLDNREDKFGFTITLYAKEVDCDDAKQEDRHPKSAGDGRIPVVDRDGSRDNFQREHDKPLQSIIPTHGKSPGGIQEPSRIGGEGTSDREQDGHLTKSMDGAIQHYTDKTESDEKRSRATDCQSSTGTDKQTGTLDAWSAHGIRCMWKR